MGPVLCNGIHDRFAGSGVTQIACMTRFATSEVLQIDMGLPFVSFTHIYMLTGLLCSLVWDDGLAVLQVSTLVYVKGDTSGTAALGSSHFTAGATHRVDHERVTATAPRSLQAHGMK
jgi:hypothetical protein